MAMPPQARTRQMARKRGAPPRRALAVDQVGDRVADIQTRLGELVVLRQVLVAQRRDLELGLPDRRVLEQVSTEISSVLSGGSPAMLKKLYAALIEKITIAPGRVAHPELRVPAAAVHLEAVENEGLNAVRMPMPSVRPPGLEPGT
jgi:hypothetical protein